MPETADTTSFPLRYLDRFLALFYPDLCQICRERRAGMKDGYVCLDCRNGNDGLEFVEQPFCRCCGLPFEGDIQLAFECSNCRDEKLYFRSARAAVKLKGIVQDVIHRYKYNHSNNHSTWFEPFLLETLLRAAKPALTDSDWDCIVPIPLHWRKLRERSFNQSLRIARGLSSATGIPVQSQLLKRTQPTQTQTRLTRAQRADNVRRAFAYHAGTPLKGERIILVDDVLTTGATANACAKLLIQNGASRVDVWTVARGVLQ